MDPMAYELAPLIGRVAELHGRATEIISRTRQDAQLLMNVHQELSVVLSSLWELCKAAPPPTTPPTGPRVLRIVEVSNRIGLGRSSVWQMVKEDQFPAPRRLSRRAVGWLDTQVDEWLRARAATHDHAGPKARRR